MHTITELKHTVYYFKNNCIIKLIGNFMDQFNPIMVEDKGRRNAITGERLYMYYCFAVVDNNCIELIKLDSELYRLISRYELPELINLNSKKVINVEYAEKDGWRDCKFKVLENVHLHNDKENILHLIENWKQKHKINE